MKLKLPVALGGGTLLAATVAVASVVGLGGASADNTGAADSQTATPIKHVVVLFDENESFDHYFGTYPNATNPAGEPAFHAKPGTPTVNGLNDALLTANPNSENPTRLDRSQAVTCSQNHGYAPEQLAVDGGLMDKFPENTTGSSCGAQHVVMDYYDGNTVTGLWNLAQNFALNDNSYSTNYGPSTVGAINLISGQTHGSTAASGVENGTVIGDPDPSPSNDDCGTGSSVMSGRNVGDLLNDKGVSWGWFQGGFRPSSVDGTGKATCATTHTNVAGGSSKDYSAHHEPFEYYPSTANQHHTPPASVDEIGHDGQANHQYDLVDFDTALANDKLPAVSFVKAAQFEDAHPNNSDPLDEQRFIARTLNALEASPEWSSTAVIIAYDDSDGWYDHQMSPFVNGSNAASDNGHCGSGPSLGAYQDRCGYGQRQPLLVISPYAKQNYVDNTLTDQTSVLKFIEDNWSLGRIGDSSFDERAGTLSNMFDFAAGAVAPKVFLDTGTGEVTKTEPMPGTEEPPTPAQTVTVTQTQTVTTPAPAPAPKPVVKAPTLKCKVTSARGKVAASCVASGGTKGVKVAVRFRLTHGGKTVATKATTVTSSKASATLKAKSIKKGTYVLYVTATPAGGSPHASYLTVKVK